MPPRTLRTSKSTTKAFGIALVEQGIKLASVHAVDRCLNDRLVGRRFPAVAVAPPRPASRVASRAQLGKDGLSELLGTR